MGRIMTYTEVLLTYLNADERRRWHINHDWSLNLEGLCRDPENCISFAFAWQFTPEGEQYWVDIYKRLENQPQELIHKRFPKHNMITI